MSKLNFVIIDVDLALKRYRLRDHTFMTSEKISYFLTFDLPPFPPPPPSLLEFVLNTITSTPSRRLNFA